jgi:hypothetical protein
MNQVSFWIALGLHWDCIGIALGLHWDCIGIALGLHSDIFHVHCNTVGSVEALPWLNSAVQTRRIRNGGTLEMKVATAFL